MSTTEYLQQGPVDLGVLLLPSDLLDPEEKAKQYKNHTNASSWVLLL